MSRAPPSPATDITPGKVSPAPGGPRVTGTHVGPVGVRSKFAWHFGRVLLRG